MRTTKDSKPFTVTEARELKLQCLGLLKTKSPTAKTIIYLSQEIEKYLEQGGVDSFNARTLQDKILPNLLAEALSNEGVRLPNKI